MNLLLDFDGTIVDTDPHIRAALIEFCAIHKFPAPSEDALRGISGLDPLTLLPPELLTKRGHAYFTMEFWNLYRRRTSPASLSLVPGIEQIMGAAVAGGFKTAVITNKEGDIARKELAYLAGQHRLPHHLCVGFGDIPGAERKPAPTMLLHGMRTLGMSPHNTVFIGDTEPDVLAARAAKIPVVLYRPRANHAHIKHPPKWVELATYVVEHMDQARAIVGRMSRTPTFSRREPRPQPARTFVADATPDLVLSD